MKKFTALLIAIIFTLTLLCSCSPQKTELTHDPSKPAFTEDTQGNDKDDEPAPVPSTEKDPDAQNKEDGENTEDPEDPENTEDTEKKEYVQPTTFARAYSNVSVLRNAFYDILSSSLTSVGESGQVLIDTYEVMSGESSFVNVSACGSGSDDIIKSSLAASGYKDVNITKDEKGAYDISLQVSVADMASEDELYTDGSFYVYYDSESDSFICEYTVSGIGTEKLEAKRISDGYVAQYIAPSGKYMRFILMDDYTGKVLIYDSSFWVSKLPDASDSFARDGYVTYYELTDDRFHSIHKGVEYTFHKVIPEGLVNEK